MSHWTAFAILAMFVFTFAITVAPNTAMVSFKTGVYQLNLSGEVFPWSNRTETSCRLMRALGVERVLYDEVVSGAVTTWTKGYPIPRSILSDPSLGYDSSAAKQCESP